VKTLLLDFEAGSASVLDEIEAGDVTVFECKDYNDVDAKVWELLRSDKSALPLHVALDSYTSLATRAIENITLKLSQTQEPGRVWMEVEKKDGFVASQPEWGKWASASQRLLWNFETLKVPFLFTAGEQLREDGPKAATIYGPDLSPKIRAAIIRYADCVGRLGILPGEAEFPDLDGKLRKWKAGTRILRLAQNSDYHAKCRVRRSRWESGKFLELLPNPTIPRLVENLGYMPMKTLIYGPAGVGKTTLICSAKGTK
jgi:hypothetical protein